MELLCKVDFVFDRVQRLSLSLPPPASRLEDAERCPMLRYVRMCIGFLDSKVCVQVLWLPRFVVATSVAVGVAATAVSALAPPANPLPCPVVPAAITLEHGSQPLDQGHPGLHDAGTPRPAPCHPGALPRTHQAFFAAPQHDAVYTNPPSYHMPPSTAWHHHRHPRSTPR
jgi:hypothetical protein